MQVRSVEAGNLQQARQAVDEAAAVLRDGGLVVIPTETVYGVAARVESEQAMAALRLLKDTAADQAFAVHLPEPGAAKRYLNVSPGLARIVRKLWPGPVTIRINVSEDVIGAKLAALGLPPQARDRLYSTSGTLSLRCPDHCLTQGLLAAVEGPVIAGAANLPDQPPAHSAEAAIRALDGRVDFVLDGGRCRYARPSTLIRLNTGKNGIQSLAVERSGIYDERVIRELTRWTMLMVCSGNTCRSPMAEAIGKQLLAEQRGIAADKLEAAGLRVISAGVFAAGGMPASPEAVAVMSDAGIDLGPHRSRALSLDMIEQADVIYCMTQGHRRAVVDMAPGAAEKTFRLDPDGDIEDPIGLDKASYQRTAAMIRKRLAQRLKERQP